MEYSTGNHMPLTILPILLHKEDAAGKTAELAENVKADGIDVLRAKRAEPAESGRETAVLEQLDPASGILVLTDDREVYLRAAEAGFAAAGVAEEGETFEGPEYLLSEFEWVSADDYVKIYQRLRGLPWTIAEGKTWILREFIPEDLDGLYALYDEEALQYLPPLSEDRNYEREALAKGVIAQYRFFGMGLWALTERESGELIGRIGIDPQGCCYGPSVGYLLRADKRGKELAGEVLSEVLRYGFEQCGLERLCLICGRENVRSLRLAERLGFSPLRYSDENGGEADETCILCVLTRNAFANRKSL